MALFTFYRKRCVDGASATVFYNVAELRCAGRLANDAPIDGFLSCHQRVNDMPSAVNRRTLFVSCNQKAYASFVVWVLPNKRFCCNNHGGETRFHVCRTSTE